MNRGADIAAALLAAAALMLVASDDIVSWMRDMPPVMMGGVWYK